MSQNEAKAVNGSVKQPVKYERKIALQWLQKQAPKVAKDVMVQQVTDAQS